MFAFFANYKSKKPNKILKNEKMELLGGLEPPTC